MSKEICPCGGRVCDSCATCADCGDIYKTDLIGAENAGYEIIDQRENDEGEIVVLGKRVTADGRGAGAFWVTWRYNRETKGYYWGHYTSSETAVKADFIERV